MEAAAGGDRDARPDRVPGQLVPEADVRGSTSSSRRRSGSSAAAAQSGITASSKEVATRFGTTESQLHEAPGVVVEPRGASQHGLRDRGRQLCGGSGGEQLGDVEGVPPGRGVDLVGVVAGERGDRALRQGRELEEHRVLGPDRADRGEQRMARRHLAAPEGEHEQRRQRADPPAEHGDRVERRVVRPVHVLEHEHRRPRRELELRDQQRLDLVRRAPPRAPPRAPARRSRRGRGRAQRPRNRQVVAGAEQHPRPCVRGPAGTA